MFESIPLVSFRRLLTSRESAIRGLSVSESELSISVTKQIDNSVQWPVLLLTIALDQSAGEKTLGRCKKLIVTNYFVTLKKRQFLKQSFLWVPQVPRSAVPQISLTL